MKLRRNDFEIEVSVTEVKNILQDGYLMDALKKAEKYFRLDENIENYVNEAQCIIEDTDDVLSLWENLRNAMPRGSKHAFLKSELKKLKQKMDQDFMSFSNSVLEDLDFGYSYFDDVLTYVNKHR